MKIYIMSLCILFLQTGCYVDKVHLAGNLLKQRQFKQSKTLAIQVLDDKHKVSDDYKASYLIGLICLLQNNNNEAEEMFRRAEKNSPENYRIKFCIGILNAKKYDFSQAFESFKESKRLFIRQDSKEAIEKSYYPDIELSLIDYYLIMSQIL